MPGLEGGGVEGSDWERCLGGGGEDAERGDGADWEDFVGAGGEVGCGGGGW